jgi:hypothetical protein
MERTPSLINQLFIQARRFLGYRCFPPPHLNWMAGRRLHQHQYNLALMPFVMNKTTSITVFGKTRISFVLVFTLAMPTLQTTYGLEFTGER